MVQCFYCPYDGYDEERCKKCETNNEKERKEIQKVIRRQQATRPPVKK